MSRRVEESRLSGRKPVSTTIHWKSRSMNELPKTLTEEEDEKETKDAAHKTPSSSQSRSREGCG